MSSKIPRGRCPVCDKRQRVNQHGKLYGHTRFDGSNFCPGSYEDPIEGTVTYPAPDPALATAEAVPLTWLQRNYYLILAAALAVASFAVGYAVSYGIHEGWNW